MNIETAKYYNELFERLKNPLTLEFGADYVRVYGGTEKEKKNLLQFIEKEAKRVVSESIRQELIEAATQKRLAEISETQIRVYSYDVSLKYCYYCYGFTWKTIKPAVEAEVSRINKIVEDKYESFRKAVEQGIAIPPSDVFNLKQKEEEKIEIEKILD